VDDPVRTLVSFGGALRAEGLRIGTDRMVRFCAAAALVGPHELYWAGRAALVARREEIEVYDRVFAAMFPASPAQVHAVSRTSVGVARATPGSAKDAGIGDDDEEDTLAAASTEEILRHKSFARCSVEELAQLAVVMGRMQLTAPSRRTRRWASASAGAIDPRRTLRHAARTGGEPIRRAHRHRTSRPRRLVLLVDVSGSMAAYARALLLFAHVGVRTRGASEVFCFGTRLTRLTAQLSAQNVDEALRRVTEVAVDRDGGTRIGDSLRTYLDEHGAAGSARGAIVIVCSDGLDVGPVDVLSAQMQRLSRLAHRVIWVNPMTDDPAYEALAQGMAAALPFVDTFLGGHNLASLEGLASELAGLAHPPTRREARR
jgi:uncharacterized protein with von Willebrand factor type A (vWA) domain